MFIRYYSNQVRHNSVILLFLLSMSNNHYFLRSILHVTLITVREYARGEKELVQFRAKLHVELMPSYFYRLTVKQQEWTPL
jgi:hypothetical protein